MTRMITITDNYDFEPVAFWPHQVNSVGVDNHGRACVRLSLMERAPMGLGFVETSKTITTTMRDIARLFEVLEEQGGVSEGEFFHYAPLDVPDEPDAEYFTDVYARFTWEDPPIVFSIEGRTSLRVSTGGNTVDEPFESFTKRLEEFMGRKVKQ